MGIRAAFIRFSPFRKDRTVPPESAPSMSRELLAEVSELDMLLEVHLQVCKALLQVREGLESEGLFGGGIRLGVLSAKAVGKGSYIGQWGRHLPCKWSIWVLFPAPHVVP